MVLSLSKAEWLPLKRPSRTSIGGIASSDTAPDGVCPVYRMALAVAQSAVAHRGRRCRAALQQPCGCPWEGNGDDRKHNQLVRRYNAQSIQLAAMRAAEMQKDATKSVKDGLEKAEKLRSKPANTMTKTLTEIQSATLPQSLTVETGAHPDTPVDPESENVGQLQEQVRQLAAQNKAQLRASEQKVAQLRAQLGRAHHSLEEARGGVPAGKQS